MRHCCANVWSVCELARYGLRLTERFVGNEALVFHQLDALRPGRFSVLVANVSANIPKTIVWLEFQWRGLNLRSIFWDYTRNYNLEYQRLWQRASTPKAFWSKRSLDEKVLTRENNPANFIYGANFQFNTQSSLKTVRAWRNSRTTHLVTLPIYRVLRDGPDTCTPARTRCVDGSYYEPHTVNLILWISLPWMDDAGVVMFTIWKWCKTVCINTSGMFESDTRTVANWP